MAYGAVASFEYDWVGQTRRPAIVLRPSLLQAARPAIAAGSNIATGTALGALFGLTTPQGAFWAGLGAAIGCAFTVLRARRSPRGGAMVPR